MDGYIMIHLDDISIYVLRYFYNFTPNNYMKISETSSKVRLLYVYYSIS